MIHDSVGEVAEYGERGADITTDHLEGCAHPHRVLQALKKLADANEPSCGLVHGVALSPGTSLEAFESLLDKAEFTLLLAVHRGWRGQLFATSTVRCVAKKMIANVGTEILLGAETRGARRQAKRYRDKYCP